VVVPVVLGAGKTMFDGLGDRLAMKRTRSCSFANGDVLLRYEPVFFPSPLAVLEH
jgi:dihydrofolate reductase